MLDREAMRKAIRGPIATVNVPEWGGEVGIRRLSAADLMKLRGLSDDAKPDDADANLTATCELLAMGLCDDSGKTIFTPQELREWDGQQVDLLRRLIGEIERHNGLGMDASEELEKNSESGPTSDST